jgi:leader peptidase (prepilin peptidase) / N-methyltransferase
MLLGFLLFILGLIFGSFINAFLWRYKSKKSMMGRSMCPSCKRQLAWYDNIPLISWLLLSGKCRYCKKPISIQYPLIEMLTAFMFLIVGVFSPTGNYVQHLINTYITMGPVFQFRYFLLGAIELVVLLGISVMLVIISVYDYKTKEIPNGFNLLFVIFSLMFLTLTSLNPVINFKGAIFSLLAALLAFLFFYAFVFFSKETWMGGGDAKMAIGMGLLLGPLGTFLAILLASVSGSIYGIAALLMTSKKKGQKEKHEIPFGPFLALGTYISMVFGAQIIDWYVRIVLGL